MGGELITLFIMATALGMDAFSVALGMGLVGLRYRQMFKIGIELKWLIFQRFSTLFDRVMRSNRK